MNLKNPHSNKLFTDGTSSQKVAMKNVIVGVSEENGEGLKSSMLSYSIIEKDEASESQWKALVETLIEGRDLINIWREIIERDYPGQEDLPNLVTSTNDMIISKLSFGGILKLILSTVLKKPNDYFFWPDCWYSQSVVPQCIRNWDSITRGGLLASLVKYMDRFF